MIDLDSDDTQEKFATESELFPFSEEIGVDFSSRTVKER